ncbi:MAG: hypothetical protein R3D69_09335 [Xanthobacteraceae bacterium]
MTMPRNDPWRWLPPLLAGIGFALTLAIFYPGIMNYDARYVYLDAQRGFYGDWQSPVMTLLWKLIDPAAPGPASMFLLIAALYWLSFALLATALARRSLALACAAPLVALTPPLFALVGVIWRDVLMAACWLVAMALVYAFHARDRWLAAARITALLLIVFGVLIRPNAIAAAPLLIGYALWPHSFSWKRMLALLVPAMLALVVTVQLVYYGALHATRQNPLHSIMVFDLGGITYHSDENQFPAKWSAEEMDALRGRCYDPSYWNVYWNGECKFVMARLEHELHLFGTPALTRAWADAIVRHPLAYLQHRLSFFRTFLLDPQLVMWTTDLDNPSQTVFADRPAFMALKRMHDVLQPTPLFRMGTWLAAALAVFALGWRRRQSADGAFVLAASGSAVLYVLSYLPLGVASEFRYIYWAVVATAAGALVLFAPRRAPADPVKDAAGSTPSQATASSGS